MKILLVSMLIVAVSGCSTTAAMIYTGVNTAASITTGKGFIDNTSVSRGKLKVTRFIKQGVHSITADLFQ